MGLATPNPVSGAIVQNDADIVAFLLAAGLIPTAQAARLERLPGGVASDIVKVESPQGVLVVKKALAKLRVEQDWRVPTSRNSFEVAWLEVARGIVPDAVPRVLAHDARASMFAMEYLDPASHPVWKSQLLRGEVDGAAAAEVGRRVAAIHAATAHDPHMARRFANDPLFHSIRLEPYLEATARVHPDLAESLHALSRRTLATHVALVHGDISPKNILMGPKGPIFLDAECAWFGDPAFDLAFCLNHLLLKCLWMPQKTPEFLAAFERVAESYLAGVQWELPDALEKRAAGLLPGLLLARIDGKSPVEYIAETDKDKVRRIARALIPAPAARLSDVRTAWQRALAQ